MEIAASVDRVLDALLDFEAYPEWARDLKGVTVDSRDERGAGSRGHLPGRGHGPQHQLHAPLHLRRGPAPHVVGARARRHHPRIDGSYTLDAGRRARRIAPSVTYDLEVELVVPLPGFVKRRAEAKIIHAALRELRATSSR